MSEKIEFITPVGRIIAGDPWTGQDKDALGAPLKIKFGPNAGQPTVKYYIALAILKTDPGLTDLFAKIMQAAAQGFPQMFDANGQCTNPQFAFKFTDGDSDVPDTKGVKPCDREGYPGHFIFRFSTGFAPRHVSQGGETDIIDKSKLKRGDYVRVAGTVIGNGSKQPSTMGIYLNMSIIEFQAFGEAIMTGPDPKAVFGGTAPALPAGASAAPIGPAAVAAPPIPVTPATMAAPVVGGAVGLPPQPAPAPHTQILQPPSLDSRLTPSAGVKTWAEMVTAGWTEETAMAMGHLTP